MFIQSGAHCQQLHGSSIEAPSTYYLWGIDGDRDVTGSCITGCDVTGSRITGNDVTGNEREIISRVFPGTPLDSWYKQWNCESNLYRVTIDLLPPMLNHFSLLNCGMCMQYMTAFSMFFCLVFFFVNKMLFIIRGFTL